MRALVRNERGSAVIIAVMAMLIMGVLSISFALLADIESRVGVSYKQQGQAEALAEAALERARDAVRTAPTVTGGFTNWLNGTTATHTLFGGLAQDLNGGQYWARIDNDCTAFIPGYPTAIQEPNHNPGNIPCENTNDYNEVAVITAWAKSGQGRSRTRAIVGVDNPWKHVCSDARPDNNGYCNEPGNRNGSPTVTPADPGDPNGPQAYTDLPRPILGCSRIAPGLVSNLYGGPYTLAQQTTGCGNFPLMYAYTSTSPYPVANNAPPRFVVMGEDPALVPLTAKVCYTDPNPLIGKYFGYFDCALQTYCDPATMPCGHWGQRFACVKAGDARLGGNYVAYNPVTGQCGTGASNQTGMVCMPTDVPCNNFNQTVGSQTMQFTMYVFRRNWSQGNNRQMYGTLVVEGPPNPGGATVFQVGGGGATQLWTGPNTCPAQAPWVAQTPTGPGNQYGFPVVGLIYNPENAAPTITPTYAPQNHFADFGSANTELHGMIYSGGHAQFNPLSMDGTVVAFEIQTQGSATYTYNGCYGNSSPPPGFPVGSGNPVVVIRKSFVVCTNFSDDSGGPTACN